MRMERPLRLNQLPDAVRDRSRGPGVDHEGGIRANGDSALICSYHCDMLVTIGTGLCSEQHLVGVKT